MSFDKAYETFVSDDDDIEGLLAYAIFKRHELRWLDEHHKANSKSPTPTESATFLTAAITSSNQYETESASALIAFAEDFVEQRRPRIERSAIEGRIAEATSFRSTVTSSIIGFASVSIILVIIALVVRLLGVDILDVLSITK